MPAAINQYEIEEYEMKAPSSRSPRRPLSRPILDQQAYARPITTHDRPAPPTSTTLTFDPFIWTPHTNAMFDRHIMLAPLIVIWRYPIGDLDRFCGWLSTTDIILNDDRLSHDERLAGIRYLGTYVNGERDIEGQSECHTLWGFATEAAMTAMHELCIGRFESKTIVQIDLYDFVGGLKTFLSTDGDGQIKQQVLTSAAVHSERARCNIEECSRA